jgi:orotidine-5'-phosphate decarboxylase
VTYSELADLIQNKKSFLCIGLDSDISKIPSHLLEKEDPVFEFNKAIIDATHDLAVAYKPNLAFYESRGLEGWQSLEKTIDYLNEFSQEIFTIADAKRGDIGNTSKQYAKAFFETLDFDAITVAPYMGIDSVSPFLEHDDKWVVLLALTSNKGYGDFQELDSGGKRLYEHVLTKSQEWAGKEKMMYVVGATRSDMIAEVRQLVPDHFLLVPGVGAQGGSLQEVAKYGMNDHCGLLVNSSRGIIFASNGTDFAERAREEAESLQVQMAELL